MAHDDLSVARTARSVDWLKAEMAGSVGHLFRLLVRGRGDAALDPLADLVMAAYLLARRLDISFEALDARVGDRLSASTRQGHQLERWFGDMSALAAYRQRRDRQ